jgi:DNA-binding MarR family transcriptional regulator
VPEVDWLDDTEMAAWLALIGVVVKLPGALDRQLQRDSGMSHFEYMVLISLSEAPGRTLRMSALAQFTDAQLPRLSQVAGRLEGRGLLTRRPDPGDGRATLASLTEAGLARVVAAAPGHAAEVRRLVLDRLTRAQLRQLREIGRRIETGLSGD